jgi:hypothetical protein
MRGLWQVLGAHAPSLDAFLCFIDDCAFGAIML